MELSSRPAAGEAGASAQREMERKHARRMQAAANRPKGMRGLLARLSGPSQAEKRQLAEERAWATGARGEQMLEEHLRRKCPEVLMLHDRRIPRSRANIDHIAVAASGVYVIDAKRYRGKIDVRKPLFGRPKLLIAGRDRTKLIDGLERQVGIVRAALSETAPEVPVHGCLCFLDPEGFLAESGLPVLRRLKIRGHALYSPRRLAKRLNESGALAEETALDIHAELARRLRAA